VYGGVCRNEKFKQNGGWLLFLLLKYYSNKFLSSLGIIQNIVTRNNKPLKPKLLVSPSHPKETAS